MNAQSFQGGWTDPAAQSAVAFRALMTAMARPGRIEAITGGSGPAPLSPAAATVLLTLCDADTRVYLTPRFDTPEVRAWLAFHTGAPLSPPELADFALGTWGDLIPLDRFRIGTAEYPDRSTTLIVEGEALRNDGATLRGPGIQTTHNLSLPDLAVFQANARHFPLGLDFLFTTGDRVAALPRTTEVF